MKSRLIAQRIARALVIAGISGVFVTFMDQNDKQDLKEAYRLQHAVGVEQADTGKFEVPNWKKDQVTRHA
jgi:hypothetical protein